MTEELTNEDIDLPSLNEKTIIVTPGSIEFRSYQSTLESVQRLAKQLEQVEVTEDGVKEAKRLRATVNKEIEKLDAFRKKIKKQWGEPFDDFESKVKEIVGIAKEANETVDNQIKDLEEIERAAKLARVEEEFNKRITMYDNFVFDFKHFMKSHKALLNKSTTEGKIETTLADWFDGVDKVVKTIANLDDSDEILAKYIETEDLATAMALHQKEVKQQQIAATKMKALKAAQESNGPVEEIVDEAKIHRYEVYSDKDAKLIEDFMKQYDIKYKTLY